MRAAGLTYLIDGLVALSALALRHVAGFHSTGSWTWVPVLLAGGVGVGASPAMELLALRRIGAALNAGLFATGPAFAFVWNILSPGEKAGPAGWVALALCAKGAVSIAVDRHVHHHTHEIIRHAHRRHHLERHHGHHSPSAGGSTEEHDHEHEHERLQNSHSHLHEEHHLRSH